MSRYKYFWDLANSKAYTSHTVDQFDANSSTGGGVFKWVYADNTAITEIAGFRIKPTSTTTGYWERETNGQEANVAWFGTINENSQGEAVNYGISSATLVARYGNDAVISAGILNSDTYDAIAIKYAFYCMENFFGFQSLKFESKNYYIKNTLYFPEAFNNDISFYKIDGNGATILPLVSTINNFTFLSSKTPGSVSLATVLTQRTFVITNLKLIGNPASYLGSNDSGILLGESKNSIIDNVYIESFDYGITLRNSSNAIIKHNKIVSTSKACIKTTYGSSYSGTIANSSSNYNCISHNNLNSLTGSTAAIIIESGEGTVIVNNLITGDTAGVGTNAIYFDNLSASNINWCNISDNIIKNVTDSGGAYLYIKSKTGIYDIKNLSCSNAGLFVEVETQTGNPEVKIRDTGEIVNNTKFKSDSTARWIFQDNRLPTSLNITSESELRTNVDGGNKTLWYSGCRSTTSVLIGTGATSFTIPINMDGYDVGNVIKIEYTTDPTQYMTGTVTSYNSATGALVVDVTVTAGAGTYATWTIYTENSTPPATNIIYRGSNGQGG